MADFEISEQGKRLLEHLGDKVEMGELQDYAKKNLRIGGNLIHAYLVDKVEGRLSNAKE